METKYVLLSKHLFQRTQQHGGRKKPPGNDEFASKIIYSSITWNKKHSSKQVVTITCILWKKFFAAAAFGGLWDISIQTVKNLTYALVFINIVSEK